MTAGQSLADGAAGVALHHLETGNWPAARAALQLATADGVSAADNASLHYGAPAIAFVLAGSDRPALARARSNATTATVAITRRRLEAAHRRIDRQQQPRYAEYDLIRGLTGLGVVLRRVVEHEVLRDVLDYVVRLTEPQGDLPGWWCSHGPDRNRPAPPGGHSNHGMAHGITGPLALLALTARDGVIVEGQTAAIGRICRWLDTWQRHTDTGVWWPQTVVLDDLRRGEPSQSGPLRPSWCYGTPGMARAQQLAGRALCDPARERLAEHALVACVSDRAQLARLTDRSLCHGTGGILVTARRIAEDALEPMPVAILQVAHDAKAGVGTPSGLLDGEAGVALASAGTNTTSWDSCLLVA